MRCVRILGGMGPEATVLLTQKVLAALPAAGDAGHVPLLVDQNPQVPSRIRHLIEGTGEDPGPVLATMARRSQYAGAEALAMPCGTAHHYREAIRRPADLPFIGMVELAADYAASRAGHDVGVIASPATRWIGLVDAALDERGRLPFYSEDEATMLAIIRRTKPEGPVTDAPCSLRAAARELTDHGARAQMIAYTEFSVVADAVAEVAPSLDPLDRLGEIVVAFAKSAPRLMYSGWPPFPWLDPRVETPEGPAPC